MNDQKKIMNIFAQAYQLIAKASKQQPSQEGFQQVLEMLGEDGIKQCAEVVDQGPEAVAQAMVQILQQKSTQKAANGAKLRYLMQLKGKCEPGYLKKGGRCKPCEMSKGVFQNKSDLLQGGGNTPLVNDARKQNKKLKEKTIQDLKTRTEGVYGKDGKLRGTKNYPYRLSGVTVTPKKKQNGGDIPEDKQWFTSKGYSQYHPDNEQEIINNFNFQQSLQRLKPKGITPKGNAYFKLSI